VPGDLLWNLRRGPWVTGFYKTRRFINPECSRLRRVVPHQLIHKNAALKGELSVLVCSFHFDKCACCFRSQVDKSIRSKLSRCLLRECLGPSILRSNVIRGIKPSGRSVVGLKHSKADCPSSNQTRLLNRHLEDLK